MQALVFDQTLRFVTNYPAPQRRTGEALIRVSLAGICNTDLEVTRGYADYRGILGHEFVGVVEDASDHSLVGQRVVGEINIACGSCSYCLSGMPTHCSNRRVLGIRAHDGAFADYLTLPARNLHVVPAAIRDDEAVFTEPLAAALQVVQQVHVHPQDRVVVLGDGKLGALAAQVLRLTGCDLLVIGRHVEKLAILDKLGIATLLAPVADDLNADIVVECTGQSEGLETARRLVHPRGTVVLKSTFRGMAPLALSPFVVDELTIVGSRCGPFAAALRLLQNRLVDVRPLLTAVYPLAAGVEAMARAAMPGIMKVMLQP